MNEKSYKRVVCYVRVSTENQLENYSIEEQKDRLTSYCKAKDWSIVKFYIDGGFSGGNINRPALSELLKDIDLGNIDMVVVYKLDRLSRSQKDTLFLIEDKFIAHGVDFVSMSENFDTSTPFGKAMIGILSVFAQLEKDQITERFTMGRIGRAKNGYYHGGSTAPYGYDYIDGKLEINEYEALQVKEVFRLFLSGQSVNAIYKYMDQKYGTWSSHTRVLTTLRNSTYTGKVKFKGAEYDGIHEAIISEEVFAQAQKLLTSPQREAAKTMYQKSPFRYLYLLTSLLYCKHCGARFTGNHGNYVCYSVGKTSKKRIIDPNCRNKRWPIEVLDKFIQDEILKLAFDDEYFDEVISNRVDISPTNTDNLEKRITEIDKQISRMIDLYQVGNIPIEQITNRIHKLEHEKQTLQEELDNQSTNQLSIEEVKSILARAKDVFEDGELSEKRLILSSLIKYIEIDNENIEIHWVFT